MFICRAIKSEIEENESTTRWDIASSFLSFFFDFYRAKIYSDATNLDMRAEIGAECEWKLLLDELQMNCVII